MLVFTSPALVNGLLDFSLARKQANKYLIIYARSYGMAETREWAVLNVSTPGSTELSVSPEHRPCIWLDSDLDRDERNLGPTGGCLSALLASNPPVIKATGRTKKMYASQGGERDASEVEILLKEDDLARFCHYCGVLENVSDDFRFEKCGGDGYTSLYMCTTCAGKSSLMRMVSMMWRNLW